MNPQINRSSHPKKCYHQDVDASYQLLRTKFYISRLRAQRVQRTRLVEQLNAGLNRRLTLVSAPAGFGKTTLMTEWAAAYPGEIAWLTLDEHDNDPVRFTTYMIAALQNVDENLGQDLGQLFKSLDASQTSEILTSLINQIHALPPLDAPHVLVLDDYHNIHDQRIHEALIFLLDNLPPQLRLVIVTRADPPFPFARLRGRGQLTELRQTDLSFSLDEADQFLTQVMGLSLSPEQATALQGRTEGWVAGLQMAALSIRGLDDAAAFIREFTGSNRYILDYLVEEVLERQPGHVQTFLGDTAVLKRMCAPLCEVLLGWDAAGGGEGLSPPRTSQDVLEYLESENLFIVPLDDHREWYRYHHLFLELLRRRLEETRPDESVKLHWRASQWFEREGLISDAIHHALAAGEHHHAAGLIERQAESFIMRSEFSTVEAWCAALPEEIRRDRPLLRAYHALITLLSGYPVDAIERNLGEVYSDDPVEQAQDEILLLHAILAFFRGDIPRTIDLSTRVLDSLPEDRLFLRGLATRNLGTVYLMIGDVAKASQTFEQDVRISQHSNDQLGVVTGFQRLGASSAIQGQLHAAHKHFRQAVNLGKDAKGKRLLIAVKSLAGLADVLREWNDLERAEYYALESVKVADRWSVAYGIAGYLVLARVHQGQGDIQVAYQVMADAVQLAVDYDATDLDDILAEAYQARLNIMTANVAACERWAEKRGLDGLLLDDGEPAVGLAHRLHHVREIEDLVLARLCLARRDPERALKLLAPLADAARRLGRTGILIEVLILQSRAYQSLDNTNQAIAHLERALALGEPQGYMRIFLDEGQPVAQLLYEAARRGISQTYVGKLLKAYQPETGEPLPGAALKAKRRLVEPLSEREIEILEQIAEGLSNREIAQRLYLSTSTVKSHIYNIYGKLDVHSRTKAVAKARALGILPDVFPSG
jgi:LuxR family maltose regulon positive regulatory protein